MPPPADYHTAFEGDDEESVGSKHEPSDGSPDPQIHRTTNLSTAPPAQLPALLNAGNMQTPPPPMYTGITTRSG
jgi:hypothetical protein